MNTEQYVTPKTTATTTDASATSAPATTVRETAAARPRKTLAEKMETLERQKNRLAQRAAALSKEARKARNVQLIAWGLWVGTTALRPP